MKVVGKYCKNFPSYILRECVVVTSNVSSNDEYVNIVFSNDDGVAVGAVRIRYESFKLVKNEPKFCIYIDSFEVCKSERGKGYGPLMYKWIEDNLPISVVGLSHRTFEIDDKLSYNFWRKMGFRKPNKDGNFMYKTVKK